MRKICSAAERSCTGAGNARSDGADPDPKPVGRPPPAGSAARSASRSPAATSDPRSSSHQHPNCVVAAVTDLRLEPPAKSWRVYRCDNMYPSLEELLAKGESPRRDRASYARAGTCQARTDGDAARLHCSSPPCPPALPLEAGRNSCDPTKEKTGCGYMMARPAIQARRHLCPRPVRDPAASASLL